MKHRRIVVSSAAFLAGLISILPATAHPIFRYHYHRYAFHQTHSAIYHASQRRGGGYGLATFYDPGPRGRGYTAANRWLPFGTHVRVTNLNNGRSVVVRIADRGPEAWTGRDLDLSRVAARSLNMIQAGVVRVAYQVEN